MLCYHCRIFLQGIVVVVVVFGGRGRGSPSRYEYQISIYFQILNARAGLSMSRGRVHLFALLVCYHLSSTQYQHTPARYFIEDVPPMGAPRYIYIMPRHLHGWATSKASGESNYEDDDSMST